jgi:hypothetical protein
MTIQHSELASAIAAALIAAQKAGLPLDINVGPAAQPDSVSEKVPAPQHTKPEVKRLTEMDEKLLRQLARAPDASLTLTDFAAAIGMDEDVARAAMRGAGRSALSVKDDLYERFDTPRSEGGKVRTYRLSAKGLEFIKTMSGSGAI